MARVPHRSLGRHVALSLDPRNALPHLDGLDGVMTAVTALLVVWTIGFVALPQTHVGSIAPAYDLILDTVGCLTAMALAVLGWIRYSETGDGAGLLQASAFVVLAMPNAVHLAVLASDTDMGADWSLVQQGQAPVYAFAISRLVVALMLTGAAFVDPTSWRPLARKAILAVPAAVVAAFVLVAATTRQTLPDLGVALSTVPVGAAPAQPTTLGIASAMTAFVLLLVAALASRRHFHRSGAIEEAYLAVGLVIGAFVEVDFAFHPAFAGFVTVGDLLRIAFYLVLLAGLVARSHVTLRTLAASNATLARLKDSEAELSAFEERARLSRELHDGLAQTLWYLKLKATLLATIDDLSADARGVADDLAQGINESINEARQAVITLRSDGCRDHELSELIARTVDEFEDRYGIRAEFTCSDPVDELPTRTEVELLRICQEALTNVARHADASVVRVALASSENSVTLAIRDNGLGFDTRRIGDGHFGLSTMRERAALIGAAFRIESEPQGGTSVAVTVPLAAASLTV